MYGDKKSINRLMELDESIRQDALDAYEEACRITPKGIHPVIIEAYRSNERSDELYAQGRTKPGNIVTNAKGGSSYHNYRLAFDVALESNGKISWSVDDNYMKVVRVFKRYGFEWGGDWNFKDYPHFQKTGGLTIAQLKAKAENPTFEVKKVTKEDITEIAGIIEVDYASLMSFVEVESGGTGFDPKTGKIIIQFEPHHFRKNAPKAASGLWSANKVENQAAEWEAFNDAFYKDPKAALLSTSIGMMQVMGFNYAKCGYVSVNAMWDDFKRGEYQQVMGAAMFIKNTPKLWQALKDRDWAKVAYYYNGSNYEVNQYDLKLAKAYAKYSGKKITTSALNVRIAAGSQYNVVHVLPKGSYVDVLEEKDGWARIGEGQWVSKLYIK